MSPPSDDVLPVQLSIQDQVDELYRQHHGWLRHWFRRRLGCSHRAEDLAHDTFIRVLRRDETLGLLEPKAFLTTIARRVVSNHWRHERIEKAYLEVLAQQPELMAPSEEERAIVLETVAAIDALLNGLPKQVKQAFLLAQLDGLRHGEIAEELDISISTVKRHLLRAGAQCYFALELEQE